MPQLVFAGAIGAALAYFLDRENGRRRRKVAVDKAGKYFRQAGRQAQGVGARAQGVKSKVARRREQEKPQPDDVTLARKVETEIFRDAEVPKGQINVNAEDGVVYLRGEVEQPEMIRDLEDRTRNVQGVLGVENLLHAPGQPAPAKPE